MRGSVQEVQEPTNKTNKERTEDPRGELLKGHKAALARAEGHGFPNQGIAG